MPIEVQHDQARNELHIIFRRDKLVTRTEWFAWNGFIEVAADDTPIAITYVQYYTDTEWTLTEGHVEAYRLGEHLDDLRLVHRAFFTPHGYGVKEIRFEDEDGNEKVVRPGG